MDNNCENYENLEKLEQIEASALEDNNEIKPIEQNEDVSETIDDIEEPQMEMSRCPCMTSCGSNYSITNECRCMGGCGSNYHK